MLRINETNDIWETAFEEPFEIDTDIEVCSKSTLRGVTINSPIVTLGKPNFWLLNTINQKPPYRNSLSEFYLCRIAFSIRALKNRVENAVLSVNLVSRLGSPTAFDMFPTHISISEKKKVKLSINPNLKFFEIAEISVGQVEVAVENVHLIPTLEAVGLGESQPQWYFFAHPHYPLRGIRIVYLIIEKPEGGINSHMEINVEAKVKTQKGILGARLSKHARANTWDF